MNIEIYGRHALLFDDDISAAFVNSDDALVEWNSLLIDRYDVRHLLSGPPPSRRRRNLPASHSSSADADLDYERYLDLPPPSEEEEEYANPEPVGAFSAVPFSYANDKDSNDQKTAEPEPEAPKFHPPFPVPDRLVQNLPPSEKVHQIIARTALFVCKNGGQSEIILRVKQGDNPTFGFLMLDHHLHPYFRFLVDNKDLLHLKDNGQPDIEEKISNGGALSLLGSVYGTGEDDDGGTEDPSSSKECVSRNTVNVDATISLTTEKSMLPYEKDEPLQKRNPLSSAIKDGRTSIVKKNELIGSLSSFPDKSRASSLPPIPKTEVMLVDPTSDMKRLVEKIVEFIIKNGRQFEAVLMEQDRGHGRFPFLIPSNIFHPYYLKVLQNAEESKLTIKSSYIEKEDCRGHIKKKSISRENENNMMESNDVPLDSERKEKFKMVINKLKKEGSDLTDKAAQSPPGVQVDADQAAAILQAATRGIKPSSLGILFGQPSNDVGSSDESHLTREQKLKAERLKRAKLFVAQLKSGAAPLKTGPSRGSSAEPQAYNRLEAKETEKSTPPSDLVTPDTKLKSAKEHLNVERRAMRKYRARSIGDKNDDDDHDDVEDERESKRSYEYDEQESEHEYPTKKHLHHSSHDEADSDDKRYKKKRKHRSHKSSHKPKHRKSHSSRHKQKLDVYSEESRDQNKADKNDKGPNSERELEDGEVSGPAKGEPLVDGAAHGEPSVYVSSSFQDQRPLTQQSGTAEVSDDLRAKIRAMLLSTM
ncbi:hypothetical protein E3N88_34958 [Mikania micrantha]|uniref:SURP motif domain-containing protein n=1 Tax=Mikania micrantha TaxID=192012 RepID=A0A5N6LZR5_9ASTR|nr:hypothetical protein E3N88_34958 [Mikania micrantha]